MTAERISRGLGACGAALALCCLLLFGVVGVGRGERRAASPTCAISYVAGQLGCGTAPALTTAAALRRPPLCTLGCARRSTSSPTRRTSCRFVGVAVEIADTPSCTGCGTATNVAILLALRVGNRPCATRTALAGRRARARFVDRRCRIAALVDRQPLRGAPGLDGADRTHGDGMRCCWHGTSTDAQRWLVAGVLLGLATFKPQLRTARAGLVRAHRALAQRRRSRVARSRGTADWSLLHRLVSSCCRNGLRRLPPTSASSSGSLSYNTNVKSLLMGLGVSLPSGFTPSMMTLVLAGVAALAWWQRRNPVNDADVQGILLAGALFLIAGTRLRHGGACTAAADAFLARAQRPSRRRRRRGCAAAAVPAASRPGEVGLAGAAVLPHRAARRVLGVGDMVAGATAAAGKAPVTQVQRHAGR